LKKAEMRIDSRIVDKNLDKMAKRVPLSTFKAMKTATEYLRGWIVKNKLSGQYLKTLTGTLKISIKSEVRQKKGFTIGRVGSNLEYARVHELGIDKMVTVKEHLRLNTITVKEHLRHMVLPAKHYIGDSIKDTKSKLLKIIGDKFWVEITTK